MKNALTASSVFVRVRPHAEKGGHGAESSGESVTEEAQRMEE